jgi:uncharacterized YigZ family protein
MEPDSYLTIESKSEGLYKEKGSRFIGLAYPVSSQDQIKEILDNLRKEHHAAKHHCYAWMTGRDRATFRTNDDGEPSGSAGKPILGQINSHGLTNILIVVVRYFGGKLLGVSGLINAYRTAAESAIQNAVTITLFETVQFVLLFSYSSMNEIMKVIKDENIENCCHKFELECSMKISVRLSDKEKIQKLFSRITGARLIPADNI